MEKNFAVIAGIIVLIVLALGGVFWYTQSYPSSTSTSTVQTVSQSPGQGQVQQPGMPVVTTGSSPYAYDTAAALSGTVNPDGSFTTYWFEYGTTQNLGSKSPVQLVGSGYETIATPQYITGLAKNTTYYFRLVAQNSLGVQQGATYSFATSPNNPVPVGSIPTTKTLAATGISRTAATLSGQVTPNKASTQFWFEYGTTQNLGVASPLQSVGDGATAVATSLPLSSLNPATTYYFRLDAQNQFGISNGIILSFKTLGPAATTTPTSVAPIVTTQIPSSVATTSAILRGTVNSNDLTTTYWFEYSANAGFGSGTKTTPQKTLAAAALTLSAEATITGLSANTTYYYRTVAQSSAGTSRGSTQSFKTK